MREINTIINHFRDKPARELCKCVSLCYVLRLEVTIAIIATMRDSADIPIDT